MFAARRPALLAFALTAVCPCSPHTHLPSQPPTPCAVNPSSFIGKVLAQAAFDTSFLRAWAELGVQTDMVVQASFLVGQACMRC